MARRAPSPVQLTRRGWTLAGAAGGLVLGALVLGADELAVLGLGGIALLAGSVTLAAFARVPVTAQRRIDQPRVTAGSSARIEVLVQRARRTGARAGPLVRVGGALLPTPVPGTTRSVSSRLSARRRGVVAVPAVRASVQDPLGLATHAWVVVEAGELLALPRVHPVSLPRGLGAGLLGVEQASVARAIAPDAHAELHTLRPYAVGDDLRRVHWRTTARVGSLMVRQDEALAPSRVVVLLDVRPAAYDEHAFEVAVEAAASVVVRVAQARRVAILGTSAGEARSTTSHGGGLDLVLDHLARVEPADGPSPELALRGLTASDGLVVAITGTPDDLLRRAVAARARTGTAILVCTLEARPAGGAVLVDASRRPFADAWNRAMARPLRPRPGLAGSPAVAP